MGIRTMLIVLFIFAIFLTENYQNNYAKLWDKSLNDFVMYVKYIGSNY